MPVRTVIYILWTASKSAKSRCLLWAPPVSAEKKTKRNVFILSLHSHYPAQSINMTWTTTRAVYSWHREQLSTRPGLKQDKYFSTARTEPVYPCSLSVKRVSNSTVKIRCCSIDRKSTRLNSSHQI